MQDYDSAPSEFSRSIHRGGTPLKQHKGFMVVVSVVMLALVVSACAKKSASPTGSTSAAPACTSGRLTGTALGVPGTGGTFTSSGVIHGLRAKAGDTVKIGMFGDLTGANSGLVKHIKQAAALAIDEANAAGTLKVKVKFDPKDNKDASKDTAPAIEQSFIDDPAVVGVVGGAFSGETLAVGNLFAAAGLVHISASATNPEITTKGWPFYRALSTDAAQGSKAAEVLKAIGCTKIAVVNDKTDYGKGLADFVSAKAKEIGLTVVAEEGVEQKTADYGPLIDTLTQKAPDAVFYGGYYADGSLVEKQAKEKGLNALFMCGDGCKDDGFVTGAGATVAEGTVFTCPCSDPNVATDPKSQKLAQDYLAKYTKKIGIYGVEAYDATNMFLAAIDASDEDGTVTRKESADFMKTIKDFPGLSKTFNFDATGEVSGGAIIVYVVKDGAIQQLGEASQVAK